MIGVVVVTHGVLAQALLEAANLIVGELTAAAAVNLRPEDGPEAAREKVEAAVDAVDQGEGVLLLVDLPGGTPCTICVGCLEHRMAEVVTGVNLSMLVKVPFIRAADGLSLEERARELAAFGARAVRAITKPECADPTRTPR